MFLKFFKIIKFDFFKIGNNWIFKIFKILKFDFFKIGNIEILCLNFLKINLN